MSALALWFYRTRQPGLLVPDGYQYLLMARGIGEGFRPITHLGPDGELWLPNPDASWKPLYPALIALIEGVGVPARTAAVLIVAAAQAALVAACGLAVWARSRSVLGSAAAAALVAASAPVHHWQSFIGPDALAAALAAGALALAFSRRPLACGVLIGLAGCARPEWGCVALALLGLCAAAGVRRGMLLRASLGAVGVAALVLGITRPPVVADPRLGLLAIGLLAAGAMAGASLRLPGRVAVGVGLCLVGAATAVVLAQGRTLGLSSLVRHDPLALLGVAGLCACLVSQRLRREGLGFAVAAGTLLGAYLLKNPDSERYLSQLIPIAAVAAGLGASLVASPRLRVGLAAGLCVALAAGLMTAPAYLRGPDPLRQLAEALPATSEPIIAGAPEGLSFYRPELSFRPYRDGARGLILSDPLSRESMPTLTPVGRVVVRPTLDFAVRRRDGRVDAEGLALIRGRLITRSRKTG